MIIVLIGPMGCGKTTVGKILSRKLHWRFEDGDDFHPQANVEKMKAGIPLDDSDRYPWLTILHDRIVKSLNENKPLVIACSALKKSYRKTLGINQQHVVSVYLEGSQELLQERITSRSHQYMSKELLASQLDTLEVPATGYSVNIASTPDAVTDSIINLLSLKVLQE